MNINKSSLAGMVLSLGAITVIAATVLAVVYRLTAAPIEEAQRQKQVEAVRQVTPPFDNDPIAEAATMDDGTTVYPARKGGELVGAAVESYSDKGFSGNISVMYGFDTDGTVTGYAVLSHAETPGLGAKMGEWFADPQGHRSVIGKNPATTSMYVTKDPGGDIDAITAATITSRAFLDALRRAHNSFNTYRNAQ